jgi:hypothetical protein
MIIYHIMCDTVSSVDSHAHMHRACTGGHNMKQQANSSAPILPLPLFIRHLSMHFDFDQSSIMPTWRHEDIEAVTAVRSARWTCLAPVAWDARIVGASR